MPFATFATHWHFVFFPDKMCFDKMTWKIEPHISKEMRSFTRWNVFCCLSEKWEKSAGICADVQVFIPEHLSFWTKMIFDELFSTYVYQHRSTTVDSDRELSEWGLFENRSFSLFLFVFEIFEKEIWKIGRRVHQFYFQQCSECQRNMQHAAWRKQTKSKCFGNRGKNFWTVAFLYSSEPICMQFI